MPLCQAAASACQSVRFHGGSPAKQLPFASRLAGRRQDKNHHCVLQPGLTLGSGLGLRTDEEKPEEGLSPTGCKRLLERYKCTVGTLLSCCC